MTRRTFLAAASASLLPAAEPIIDIHQHTHYSGRSDEDLFAHQRRMGITKTVLLPAGRRYGLAADAGGNDTVVAIAARFPGQYYFFANELPDLPDTREVLETYLKRGAIGIGEQKFGVDCDSKYMDLVADIAEHFDVPVLMHFQYDTYNLRFERLHKLLERHPKVNFIGHAQTWWGNIDIYHEQNVMYPKGKVHSGGMTDRLLSDYPNMYGDLSAGSGLNALQRDEEEGRRFLERHQDKLLYGSDCSDSYGEGPGCSGSQQIAMVRKLSPNKTVERKLLYDNAARLLKIR